MALESGRNVVFKELISWLMLGRMFLFMVKQVFLQVDEVRRGGSVDA